jgi:anti-sigma factor RsiW
VSHCELEELLGAYALDAVEAPEAALVESHLDECPRCRAELAQHLEMASLFSTSPERAPSELWQRISDALTEPDPEYVGHPTIAPLVSIGVPRDSHRKVRAVSGVLGVVAALAAVAAVVLALQLSILRHQVNLVRSDLKNSALAQAVSDALVNPHTEALLSSRAHDVSAEVVITPGGESYWVHSSLPPLKPGETYQLWAFVNGRIVSLGLVGRKPTGYSAFRLGRHSSRLMVTAEPAGGTAAPTTSPILVSNRIQF